MYICHNKKSSNHNPDAVAAMKLREYTGENKVAFLINEALRMNEMKSYAISAALLRLASTLTK